MGLITVGLCLVLEVGKAKLTVVMVNVNPLKSYQISLRLKCYFINILRVMNNDIFLDPREQYHQLFPMKSHGHFNRNYYSSINQS